MKRFTKIMAIIMATALIMTVAAISASAANYTAVAGTSTSFNKYLIVDEDAEVPAITFEYTIAPGTAIEPTASTLSVFAGVGTPVVGTAAYAANDTKLTAVANGDNVTLDSGENYVKKVVNINFASVNFTEPGIYRYILTEQEIANVTGVEYDTQKTNAATAKTRILDVYVTDNNGALTVSSYVLHDTAAAVPDDVVTNDGDRVADKSDGFVNEYKTSNLEFGKEVTGNQGSKDKYFDFTLTIANALPNTAYTVDLANAEATSGSNAATIADNSGKTNAATITTDATGGATVHYYLKDGQYVKVKGLPQAATYTLTENNEDYVQTPGITTAVSGKTQAYAAPASTATAIGPNDVYVGFTNEKQGVIPTGVLLTIAPFAIGILLFGALIIFFIAKRRRNNY